MRQAKHDAVKNKKNQNPKTVLHRFELKVLINYTKKRNESIPGVHSAHKRPHKGPP